jgi:predicted house-cleaning noncanonical NTP pyrophosphatase (MazG superfamily)
VAHLASGDNSTPLHCCAAFQKAVDEYLIRHRSVLDVLSKFQEASARTNRAVTKSVTACGCVSINAKKQDLTNVTYAELKDRMATHLDGELCEHCREVLESELGHTLFYIAALCNQFGLDFEDVLNTERKRISALGMYNLT